MKKVLITGGSGLIGTYITAILHENGVEVVHLSRSKSYKSDKASVFVWDTNKKYIEDGAFDGVDTIINLAGAGIVEQKWTAERKKIIIESRVQSVETLVHFLKNNQHDVKKIVGASAIGFYPSSKQLVDETHQAGDDYLSHVCQKWENAYSEIPINTAIVRIGIVLAKQGGAFPEMTKTLPFFVGVLGDGEQYYSWIHIYDLAQQFIHLAENTKFTGIFNGVSPNAIPQKEIAKAIAQYKNTITMPTPSFALQIVLGERKDMVLNSQKCSSKKIEETGFQFKYNNLEDALSSLF